MTAGLKDRIIIHLRIGDKEVPLRDNFIDSVHIVESVLLKVPMMTLVVKDVIQYFTYHNLLVDGAPIELSIETDKRHTVYYFRMFNNKESTPEGTTTHRIHAYLDVPRYWTESLVTPIRGSVSAVLKQICDLSGLTFDGPVTADSQLWIPRNKRMSTFAQETAEHAWISETSCCKMAVTTDKKMLLRDISKMATDTPIQYFSNKPNTDSQTLITGDYAVLTASGLTNAQSGYRDTRVAQSTVGPDDTFKALGLAKNSTKLMLNQAIHDGLAQNRVSYAPVNVGNIDPSYEKALYQNNRLLNLFSFGLEFMTNQFVDAQLLDVVNCEIAKPNVEGAEAQNGKYIVGTKVTYLAGLNYYTKCLVFRHGLNAQISTQV